MLPKLIILLFAPTVVLSLQTLYEYYTGDGITSGLSVDQPYFTLNGKNITIYSGGMHYFRVPRPYWRDRLRKIRAAGLNAVETYISWNLHEPQPGVYDFGNGGTDMQDFLNITEFLTIAQEEDLLVILRPGPYICAEWELGGFPSWMLREEGIQIRTSDPKYMKLVERYFNVLLPILSPFQFTKGGPVIAFQVENEYSNTQGSITPEKEYLKQLRTIMLNNGLVELLVTADGPGAGDIGTIPEYFFMTGNFGDSATSAFDRIQSFQPGKPSMSMEFYGGWFDHWAENHNSRDIPTVMDHLEEILKYPGSFNMYMFHGGTDFGFTNGANVNNNDPNNSGYQPDTTSYGYDAPITEDGNCTEKYYAIKDLVAKYNEIETKIPDVPELIPLQALPTLDIKGQIPLSRILEEQEPMVVTRDYMVPMELLPINNNTGQSFGYIAYRKSLDLPANSTLEIKGYIKDTLLVLVNGEQLSPPLKNKNDLDNTFGSWRLENSTLVLTDKQLKNAVLELVVENFGRVGFGPLKTVQAQYKGFFQGEVLINDEVLGDWDIIPLEFKKEWNNNLKNWEKFDAHSPQTPTLYQLQLIINGTAPDTYLDMGDWTKGIVIVNGFVLGRYFSMGPSTCLYLPGVYLKSGSNEIIVFEHFQRGDGLKFSDKQIYVKYS